MSERTTGLSKFVQKKTEASEQQAGSETRVRKRGKGETVAITVRLTRSQWERLHQLAISEGDSLQGLAIRGLSSLMREKGLGEL